MEWPRDSDRHMDDWLLFRGVVFEPEHAPGVEGAEKGVGVRG